MSCIQVKKTDQFFLGLGQADRHTFLMLGVVKQSGEFQMLARLGKTNKCDLDFDNPCKMGLKVLFSSTASELQKEPLNAKGNKQYIAYEITYELYLQFLEMLKRIDTKQELECYQPDGQNDKSEMVTLKLSKVEPLIKHTDKTMGLINQNSHKLSIGNTCRHTAINLAKHVMGVSQLSDSVSSLFFKKLPLSVEFKNGKPQQHFYIFPLPPSAYSTTPFQARLLKKLYKRMEVMVEKDVYSEATIKKFEAVKALYQGQAKLAVSSLDEVLKSILSWKTANLDVLSALRAQSFLGKLFVSRSSTLKLIESLEKDCSKARC